MMRTSTLWQVLLLALCAQVGVASAQTPAASAPPKLEKIEEVADDPITVNAKPAAAEKKITEKREGGRVTEAKVKSGKSTYTVKPNIPVGSALPGDAVGSANRGPNWTVMEFDLGKKKKKNPEEEAADTSVPPPPPPAKQ